jgi:chromosome segregation ATPase
MMNNNDIGLFEKMFDVNIDELLQKIKNTFDEKNKKIKILKNEISELKDSHYRDKELSRLKTELDNTKQDLRRGFPITEYELNKINEWKRKHEEVHGLKTIEERLKSQGCCGGVYEYRFIPTSIGVIGSIICSRCGDSFKFRELN